MTAGEPHGVKPFGMYALDSLRIEKGYHGWGTDFGTEYTPFDAGLEKFIAFDKQGFVGRDAVIRMRSDTPDWQFAAFELDSPDADAMPSAAGG